MITDGMLGPKAVLLALSALTTGNLNSKLKKEAKAYRMADVLPSTHEYIVPPLTPEEEAAQAQKALVAFAQANPGKSNKLNKVIKNG